MEPTFHGLNHFAVSVSDLDRSTAFYTEVLGFVAVLDFGQGRICLHRQAGYSLGLVRHPDGEAGPFSELRIGLDHLGFAATDRDELVAWQERFDAADVQHSGVVETAFGWHLNFRDPDGIALEFNAPNAAYSYLLEQLRTGAVPDDVLLDQAEAALGPGIVIRS